MSIFKVKILKTLFSLVVLLLLCFSASCKRGSEVGLNPGDLAPDLDLVTLKDKPVKLSTYHGKLTILNFWASWCVPCIGEMPELDRLYAKLKSRGLEVVAVALDDQFSAIKKFQDDKKLAFPVLYDRSNAARHKYKLAGYPETFLLDKQGRILIFPDPSNPASPVTRIVGPRPWASESMIHFIDELLKKS